MLLLTVVTMFISLIYMGAGISSMPAVLLAALIGEVVMFIFGGSKSSFSIIIGVAVYDIFFRVLSLSISWLIMRENPTLMVMVIPIIIIGYIGALVGLFSGFKSVRELRHAGIIRD